MTDWLLSTFSWLPTDHNYYLLIFAITFFESFVVIGLIMPGSTLAVIAGFLAYHGQGDIYLLAATATLGSACGDGLSYFIGLNYGDRLSNSRFLHRYDRFLIRGKDFFDNHGFKSVFFARFIGFFRPFIPFIAGWMRMPSSLFFIYMAISCILWGIAYPGLGYLFGESWQMVSLWSGRFSFLLGALLFAAIASHLFWRELVPRGRKLFHRYTDKRKGVISTSKLSAILAAIVIAITLAMVTLILWYQSLQGGIDLNLMIFHGFAALPASIADKLFWLSALPGTPGFIMGALIIGIAILLNRGSIKETVLLVLLTVGGILFVAAIGYQLPTETPPPLFLPQIEAIDNSGIICLFLATFIYPTSAWLLTYKLSPNWHERIVTLVSTMPVGLFLARLYLGYDWTTTLLIGVTTGVGFFFLFLAVNPSLPGIYLGISSKYKRYIVRGILLIGVILLLYTSYQHLQQRPIRFAATAGEITAIQSFHYQGRVGGQETEDRNLRRVRSSPSRGPCRQIQCLQGIATLKQPLLLG